MVEKMNCVDSVNDEDFDEWVSFRHVSYNKFSLLLALFETYI